MENRKNTIELYGYDFMISNDFKPWLIEINSSPAMDYSTVLLLTISNFLFKKHITKRLVKECLGDIIKVLVDYGFAKGKKKKLADTGKWKCILKGKEIAMKGSVAANIVCEGKKITKK